ncbi:MAG: asparagine synthase (glutamine-hydrolyzing) [Actinomycetota bacterium]|nr:asparagine synthase (glutamine-hydrolyzing) [Actinomycetota bacterium]
MCGIAGTLSSDLAPRRVLNEQLALLEHRGPDSRGVYEQPGVLIGQTRLAVIDLVTGDPPITNEDGSVGAVLNGEVYNFRQLRDELTEAGHAFRTQGDTEVLAHLGEDADAVHLASRLDGMFAFAIWDQRRRRLILGRDRLGKKPLYYWCDGHSFVFGSEIKAVLAHPAVPRRLAPEAVPAYFTFGYVPTPRTFYEGICSVPPGHVLTVEPGRDPLLQPYWEPRLPGATEVLPVDLTFGDAAIEVRRLLTAAVEKRLISDVPLGAFLSGGVDSSTIVSLMAGLTDHVSTFTIGFEDDEGFDERPYARLVAQRWGTEHVEFVVRPDAADLLERLVWHHDQPFGDSSALPTFLLSELTRKHVTVALSGDGGDELFGGYERFAAALIRHRLRWVPGPVATVLHKGVSLPPVQRLGPKARGLRRLLSQPHQSVPTAFLSWISYVPIEWRDALLPGCSDWAVRGYEEIWNASDGAGVSDRLLDLNLRTYLLDDLLPKVDRMAMAHALEVRSPFLDKDLVEFALRLPASFRLRGLSLKRVLKAAVGDLLPHEVLHRRKHGFGIPLDRWLRTDLEPFLDAMLCAPSTRLRRYVVPEELDRLIGEHRHGIANHGHSLWTLLTLEVFLRREDW